MYISKTIYSRPILFKSPIDVSISHNISKFETYPTETVDVIKFSMRQFCVGRVKRIGNMYNLNKNEMIR